MVKCTQEHGKDWFNEGDPEAILNEICRERYAGFGVINSRQTDLDIYILSEDETRRVTEDLRNQCEANRTADVHSPKYARGDYCFAHFDGLLCWSTTPANASRQLPCPAHVSGVKKSGVAEIRCNETSCSGPNQTCVWVFGRTDYKQCLTKDGEQWNSVEFIILVSHVGCAISAVSLILAITIMLWFRPLRCTRNTVHINLFFVILLRSVIHYLQAFGFTIMWVCRSLTALTTFTSMATYSWVFVEALFLHNTVLVHVMHESSISLLVYALVGWIPPLIVTLAWILIRIFITTGTQCWIVEVSRTSPSRLLVILYPVVVILLNVTFFVNILRVILLKMKSQPMSETSRLKTILKSTSVLVLVFGIYHIIFIPLDLMTSEGNSPTPTTSEIVKLLYQQIMDSFQGFFVAVLLCFMNKEVTSEIRRWYRRVRLRTLTAESRRQSNSLANQEKCRGSSLNPEIPLGLNRPSPKSEQKALLHSLSSSSPSSGLRDGKQCFLRPGSRRPSPLCHPVNS